MSFKIISRLGIMAATILSVMACSVFSGLAPAAEPDVPTPTPTGVGLPKVNTPSGSSRCDGLNGELELQVLVGPAETVGLEPVAIGSLPFSVMSDGGVYLVQGGGAITYQDVLEKEWGTYTVNFDMTGTVGGECVGSDGNELLNINLEVSGEQLMEVEAKGFKGEYPWSGAHTIQLSFPLMDGATSQGEGWVIVLHLSQ